MNIENYSKSRNKLQHLNFLLPSTSEWEEKYIKTLTKLISGADETTNDQNFLDPEYTPSKLAHENNVQKNLNR